MKEISTKEVLTVIGTGHNTLSDLVDYMGIDGEEAWALADELERAGYIKRRSPIFLGMLTFDLTDKGYKHSGMDELRDKKYKLIREDVEVLKALHEEGGTAHIGRLIMKTGLSSGKIISITANLEEDGLIDSFGQVRKIVKMTDKGREAVAEYTTKSAGESRN
ncbi:MAG TPA: hypothetical protein GXX40_08430 [Firmicutes bacterium]|nr:hypothetical protein [Bacillota bacterium]